MDPTHSHFSDNNPQKFQIQLGWLEDHSLEVVNLDENCPLCNRNLARNFLLVDMEIEFEPNCQNCFRTLKDSVVMEFVFGCSQANTGHQPAKNVHNVFYSLAGEYLFQIPDRGVANVLTIILSIELYDDLIPTGSGLLGNFTKKIRKGQSCSLFPSPIPITPYIQSVINDIEKCTYSGELKCMYFKNKIQELLLLQFDLYHQNFEKLPQVKVKEEDFEKLKQAKAILDLNFVNAPTIGELSKMVFLNEHKLKKEFKTCFGISIKQYIIDLRMKLALDLLKEDKHTITEIAEMSGYNGLVQFSTAFKKYYKISPSSIFI